jgi:hypothetical protein
MPSICRGHLRSTKPAETDPERRAGGPVFLLELHRRYLVLEQPFMEVRFTLLATGNGMELRAAD